MSSYTVINYLYEYFLIINVNKHEMILSVHNKIYVLMFARSKLEKFCLACMIIQCFVLQKELEQNYSTLRYPEFPETITDHNKESEYESVTTTISLH